MNVLRGRSGYEEPSKVSVVFLFVPRKKAWQTKFAWPQALKRWPGRLLAIKLRINDGFGMFFWLYFVHSSLLYPPPGLVSICGSCGRDEARVIADSYNSTSTRPF